MSLFELAQWSTYLLPTHTIRGPIRLALTNININPKFIMSMPDLLCRTATFNVWPVGKLQKCIIAGIANEQLGGWVGVQVSR